MNKQSITVTYVISVLIAVIVSYQLFVSIRVLRDIEYSKPQKLAQLFLIWLIPLLGAVIAHMFITSNKSPLQVMDKNFTRQDCQADIYPDSHHDGSI